MEPLHQTLLVANNRACSRTAFNYATTFEFMNQRRMQRQFQGVYAGPSKWMTWLAQLVWLYAVAMTLLTSTKTHAQVSLPSAMLTLAALLAVQYVAHRQRSRILLLVVYVAVVAHVTFFAVFDDAGLFLVSTTSSQMQRNALIALAVVETLILLVYSVVYHLYPLAVQREWLDTHHWFALRRGRRANTLRYRAFSFHWPYITRRRFTVQYKGGLDEQFRPHGYGTYKDSFYHGETLVGAWKHGLPVGPFTSREQGTGFASQQIRVAYGAFRSETGTDERHYVPKFPADKTIRWGVARLECSVAGGFFTFLPRVDHFDSGSSNTTTTWPPRSASDCIDTLRTPLDNVFYRDTETHEIVSDSTVASTQYRESIEPTTLTPLEQQGRKKEALVFIHGIDNSLDDAIRLCGQLLARGDFPSEIHPFVFSWASGSNPVVSYWMDKQCAESDDVATALQTFTQSILNAGYTKVHYITHSMGTRVFLKTVERGKFQSLFRQGPASAAAATMATVTLCSPEFPLARFVAADGTYDILHTYCSQITIYGDEHDLALRVSEFTNRDWNWCGARVRSLGCNVKHVARDATYPVSDDAAQSPFSPLSPTVSLAAVNAAAGFKINTTTQGPTSPQQQQEPKSEPDPSGYGTIQEYDDDADSDTARPRQYLDVDVINTSFIDINVGSNRHSYFRVNESIVEDIRDLVLHRRRAERRAGLMRQRDNIFNFLTAPKDSV